MKRYVDGFVLPVPSKHIKKYQAMASKAGKIWMEYGALQYVEAVAEDTKKHAYCLAFPQMVNPKKGETIIFAFIIYKSRAHRDKVNAQVMKDPRMNPANAPADMPFNWERMAYSGFETLVNL